MIAVSLLIPVSLLCLVPALGRYEERLLGPLDVEEAPAAGDGRHLRAVPVQSPDNAPPTPAEAAVRPETGPVAPGGPGLRRQVA
ncbi:hypothetical protein [Streptomyces sp. NPDC047079]|uniref:hypothetical protein n=1 Tax=Streptomyces sp. NPDC047079 TaxID=3154607 RepID=UPI0033E96274